MAVTVENLVPPVLLTASIATYYTALLVKAILDKVTLCNTTAAAVTVDVHLVPVGGSATAATKLVDAVSINAHTTYSAVDVVGHVLEAGSTLQAVASSAAAVSLRVSGREVT